MRTEKSASTPAWRGLALVCVVILGLVTIVGSGGGAHVDGCILGPCPGYLPPELPATPTIDPPNIVAQVGATVVFSARAPGVDNATYQWQRAPRGFGGPFFDIPGATGSSYSLAGVQLLDDDVKFQVNVHGSFNGNPVVLASLPAQLTVSSMPGIVFEDSEFAPADWAVAAISEPATNGPTHVEEQATSGGNPGAYRKTTITMPAGPTRLLVFDTLLSASYDPATQGAVYRIAFTQDYIALPGALGVLPALLIEQDGRRYMANGLMPVGTLTWTAAAFPAVFDASAFYRVDGPACAAGEPCPNFSATGTPIRFGFANGNEGSAGFAGASGGFGVDNWKVTVWRK
jgi:hypothetical protein